MNYKIWLINYSLSLIFTELLTEDLKAKTTDLVSAKEELNKLRSQYEQLKDESSCKQLDLQQEIELSTERNEVSTELISKQLPSLHFLMCITCTSISRQLNIL